MHILLHNITTLVHNVKVTKEQICQSYYKIPQKMCILGEELYEGNMRNSPDAFYY